MIIIIMLIITKYILKPRLSFRLPLRPYRDRDHSHSWNPRSAPHHCGWWSSSTSPLPHHHHQAASPPPSRSVSALPGLTCAEATSHVRVLQISLRSHIWTSGGLKTSTRVESLFSKVFSRRNFWDDNVCILSQAFKLIVLTRLTPVPFGLQNAVFSVSKWAKTRLLEIFFPVCHVDDTWVPVWLDFFPPSASTSTWDPLSEGELSHLYIFNALGLPFLQKL